MFNKLFGKKSEDSVMATESVEVAPEVRTDTIESGVLPVENITTDCTTTSPENIDSAVPPKESSEKKEKIPSITHKEIKALKKARYEDVIMRNPRFKKMYVIENIKTGQVVEIRAASSFHACNIIGWKRNKVRLIEEREVTPFDVPADTIMPKL